MKRKLEMLAPAALLSAILLVGAAAIAMAASSPAVTTGTRSDVTETSGELHGSIDPNDSATTYYFEWGPTTAYGVTSAPHSAGHGTKPVSVATTAKGLIPGTVYHYRLVATNGSGTATGADRKLHIRGSPAARRVDRSRHADEQERRNADRRGQPEQADDDLLLPVRHLDDVRLPDDRRDGSRRNDARARVGERRRASRRRRSSTTGSSRCTGDTPPQPGLDGTFMTLPVRRPVPHVQARPARATRPASRSSSPPPDRSTGRHGSRPSTTAAGMCRFASCSARAASGRRWCRSDPMQVLGPDGVHPAPWSWASPAAGEDHDGGPLPRRLLPSRRTRRQARRSSWG